MIYSCNKQDDDDDDEDDDDEETTSVTFANITRYTTCRGNDGSSCYAVIMLSDVISEINAAFVSNRLFGNYASIYIIMLCCSLKFICMHGFVLVFVYG